MRAFVECVGVANASTGLHAAAASQGSADVGRTTSSNASANLSSAGTSASAGGFPSLLDLLLQDFQLEPDQPPADSASDVSAGEQTKAGGDAEQTQDRKKRTEEDKDRTDGNSLAIAPPPFFAVPRSPLLLLSFGLPTSRLAEEHDAVSGLSSQAPLPAATVSGPLPGGKPIASGPPFGLSAGLAQSDLAMTHQGEDQGRALDAAGDFSFGARLTPEISNAPEPPTRDESQGLQELLHGGTIKPALSLQPVSDPQDSTPPVVNPANAIAQLDDSASQTKPKLADDAGSLKDLQSDGRPPLTNVVAPQTIHSAPETRTEPAAQTSAPAPKTATEFTESQNTTRSDASRGISLRLGGPDSASVDVQVVERSGRVQVAVRSTDADLSSSLRQNLGDLVSSLASKGYRAETWAPTDHSPVASIGTGNDSRASSHSDQSGQGAGQGGGERGGGQRQQQHRRAPWNWEFGQDI